ncbi:hypothetical protein KRE40_03895 [Elizabethkingia meningoseptica]|uniref:hypothetical protein n=1 Tax=Elizabethkingia meningoseptica TaxID=238 RepID=UPI0023AE87A1|nr:hypothetical protein [Elizabethkingia meningoseptica]MDE5438658.1 hypothetical protein [Elizabethkingia meningoseptica]MDE5507793.1 hypothetical protein [Elizabethkingia meningoseptica]MDE5516362.1 hypothetical protein [Elizabethkingia meningoseptica]MDE5526604.1 hypothetical protein [Elizabethkingia meningoseptica]MDE5530672.1 hypothetical protein [Elizabethkingia meningoseptica]
MSIKDKLRLEVRQDIISLQPNRKIINSLLWFAAAIIITAVILVVFREKLGEGGQILCIAIIAYFFIHGLIDIVFRLNVRYTFDKHDNAVYRDNFPFGRKKLMQLDEAVIFTSSESGDWHYSLRIKKKQFLKNYKISPRFGSGKISIRWAAEYEEKILFPIMDLLEKDSL